MPALLDHENDTIYCRRCERLALKNIFIKLLGSRPNLVKVSNTGISKEHANVLEGKERDVSWRLVMARNFGLWW